MISERRACGEAAPQIARMGDLCSCPSGQLRDERSSSMEPPSSPAPPTEKSTLTGALKL